MSDNARRELGRLLATYGHDLARDPRRCQALLRDVCPEDRREIAVLTAAAEEGVPDRLLTSSGPPAVTVPGLAQELAQARALDHEAAAWAVAAWASALGLEAEPATVAFHEQETIQSDEQPPPSRWWEGRAWVLGAASIAAVVAVVGIVLTATRNGDTREPTTTEQSNGDATTGPTGDNDDADGDESDESDASTWQVVEAFDETIELRMPLSWEGESRTSWVQVTPDPAAWHAVFDGTRVSEATAVGFVAELLSVDELGVRVVNDDVAEALLAPEPVPVGCAFDGVAPLQLGDFRGYEEVHDCDSGFHRIGTIFAPDNDDYLLRYRSVETPDTAATIEAVRSTILVFYTADVIRIDRLWRGLSRAFEQSRDAAGQYVAGNNYPGLGYSAGECASGFLDEERYVLDRTSLTRDDAWVMPDGPLVNQAVAGRVYVMDRQVPALRKYAPDGRYLATFGRAGGGPGTRQP
jgi:hypothetical protein